MSVEAVWDLQTKASPRCMAVYPAISAGTTSSSRSTNPFDSGRASSTRTPPPNVVATVFGTDHGSFHYRTYPTSIMAAGGTTATMGGAPYNPASVSSTSGGSAASKMAMLRGATSTTTTATNSSAMTSSSTAGLTHQQQQQQQQQQSPTTTPPLLPLGGGGRGRAKGASNTGASPSSSSIPRHFYPMDLGSLPGPVVQSLVLPNSNTSRQQQQTFLLLVDDSRVRDGGNNNNSGNINNNGSSSGRPALYLALLVTSSLATPGFQVRNPLHPVLRMSCATVVPSGGTNAMVVYGTGRSLRIFSPDGWINNNNNKTVGTNIPSSSSSNSTDRLWTHTLFPAPGIRNGSEALIVTARNRVAVAAVGHTFYAAAAVSHNDEPNHNNNNSSSAAPLKILSFQPSSQVHPAIVLDLHDPSLIDDNNNNSNSGGCWSSLFLASGRECAVVDLYTPSMLLSDITTTTMNASAGSTLEEHGTTTTSTSAGGWRCSLPRHGVVTFPAPILAAAVVAKSSWIAVLQSDGLVHLRSPACLAIALRTVEVGQRPNDYFGLFRILVERDEHFLSSRGSGGSDGSTDRMVCGSHSGEVKLLCWSGAINSTTSTEAPDRLVRLCIDALGPTGFPRTEVAEAVQASFTATSYNSSSGGDKATAAPRLLLKQYLEAYLGLSEFESGAKAVGWPTELRWPSGVHHSKDAQDHDSHAVVHHGTFGELGRGRSGSGSLSALSSSVSSSATSTTPALLLTSTAMLCLVCSQIQPPDAALANRAAKAASERMGVVFWTPENNNTGISPATVTVCDQVAERLLREASSAFSLSTNHSPTTMMHSRSSGIGGRSSQSNILTDFIQSAVWLLRACGRHERAIAVASERLQQQPSTPLESGTSSGGGAVLRGFWSQIKYESYTATHLSELWGAQQKEGCQLVLESPATLQLLESNPRLGLSVFTAQHPQNEAQWRDAKDDPLAKDPDRIYDVIQLLKSAHPQILCDQDRSFGGDGGGDGTSAAQLPLESGRALAISFLRSAIGIATGRTSEDEAEDGPIFDVLSTHPELEEHLSNFHDELSFLLLEGVIAERSGDDTTTDSVDTELGMIYRTMLRELLKWPLAMVRSEQFMDALPPTFLQEKALVLGRLNRHEDAVRILYRDLQSLDLALEYCDDRFAQQKLQQERRRTRQQQLQNNNAMFPDVEDFLSIKEVDNAYLPLVRVALESSEDTERGTATAIQVLALRRSAIDRAAALRLLPSDVPVSAVARPFLIPALVDSESQVRRMTVVSALLRSRFLRLKDKLTAAQLKAQANIYVVPALKTLNLGDPLHSTKSFRVRTVNPIPGATMPYIEIVKHFFPRHLVIQAKVTNVPYASNPSAPSFPDSVMNSKQQSQPLLSDVAFVVAESSEEEAIQPLLQVPIQVLPPKMTGSAWCVLQAAPPNMDGPTAQLTCELRYAVQSVDNNNNNNSINAVGNSARTFVEELQDIEVHAAHFS